MANRPIQDARDTWGVRLAHTVDHDGPASYTTGGETINATVFGMKALAHVIVGGSDNSAFDCAVVFTGRGNRASFKLMWFVVATGVEVANAFNLSGRFVRLTAIGR